MYGGVKWLGVLLGMEQVQGVPFKTQSNYNSICKLTGNTSIVVLFGTSLLEYAQPNA
jgi:hypothetical protein